MDSTLEDVLTVSNKNKENVGSKLIDIKNENIITKNIYLNKNETSKPRVFIPVFPGTNGEYDTIRAFKEAGADVESLVFRNLSSKHFEESINAYAEEIKKAQILVFAGGISLGDEPGGSGKFIANVLNNQTIKEATTELVDDKDGLILGISNGFQALIKLGLVPFGEIRPQNEESPTLVQNIIGRHVAKVVNTKVVSNKSPC